MKTLYIDTYNTLFFREGNDATFGGDVFSKGVFPPNPTTLYGALRAMVFENNPNLFNNRNEPNDPTLDILIKGILLLKDGSFLVPLPFNHVIESKDENLLQLKLRESSAISPSENSFKLYATGAEKVKSASNVFIAFDELKNYLNGDAISTYYPISELISSEESTHIALDTTGKAKDGALFVHQQLELYKVELSNQSKEYNQLSIVVLFDNVIPAIEIPEKGNLALGSDGKICQFVIEDKVDLVEIEVLIDISEGDIVQYYLLTHLISSDGAIPSFIKATDSGFSLLTYATDRPLAIGGFDMKNKEAKAMYRTIPAGAIYFLKVENVKNANDTLRKYHGHSASDYLKNEGYGIGFFGKIDEYEASKIIKSYD